MDAPCHDGLWARMDVPPATWRTRRSAIASTPRKRTLRVAALGYLPCMRFWGFLARLVVTVLVLLTVVGGALFGLSRTPWWSSINPFSTRENDRTGPSVLRSLNDISEFHPAYAHYETVVDLEDDTDNLPSWVSGGRVIYVGKGNVDAVVDFGRLNQSSVVVSPDGESVAVDLPLPSLTPQLPCELGDLGETGGAHGMSAGGQPPARIHDMSSAQVGHPAGQQRTRVSVLAQTELLVVEELAGRHRVMDLEHVDVGGTGTALLVGERGGRRCDGGCLG